MNEVDLFWLAWKIEKEMLKEYGVTSPATALCEFCGSLGKKTGMARVSRGEGKNHWVHANCVLDEITKRKEE